MPADEKGPTGMDSNVSYCFSNCLRGADFDFTHLNLAELASFHHLSNHSWSCSCIKDRSGNNTAQMVVYNRNEAANKSEKPSLRSMIR